MIKNLLEPVYSGRIFQKKIGAVLLRLQIYIFWYFIIIDVGGFKYIDNIYDHDATDIVKRHTLEW